MANGGGSALRSIAIWDSRICAPGNDLIHAAHEREGLTNAVRPTRARGCPEHALDVLAQPEAQAVKRLIPPLHPDEVRPAGAIIS